MSIDSKFQDMGRWFSLTGSAFAVSIWLGCTIPKKSNLVIVPEEPVTSDVYHTPSSSISDLTEFSSDPDVREQQIADLLRTHMPGDLELEYQEPEAYNFTVFNNGPDDMGLHFPDLKNYRNHQEPGVTVKVSDERTLALTVDAYKRIQEGYPELFYAIAEVVTDIKGNYEGRNSSSDKGSLSLNIDVLGNFRNARDFFVSALIEEASHIADSYRISSMVGKKRYGDDWIHYSSTEQQTAGPDGESRVRAFNWYASDELGLSPEVIDFVRDAYGAQAVSAGLELTPDLYFVSRGIDPGRFLREGHEAFREFYQITRPPVEVVSE